MDINKIKEIINGFSDSELSDFITYVQSAHKYFNDSINSIINKFITQPDDFESEFTSKDPSSLRIEILNKIDQEFVNSGLDLTSSFQLLSELGFPYSESLKLENYLDSLVAISPKPSTFFGSNINDVVSKIDAARKELSTERASKEKAAPIGKVVRIFEEPKDSEESPPSKPVVQKNIQIKPTVPETILANLSTRRDFFEDNNHPENYAIRLALEMAKKDSGKNPANFYPPFASLPGDNAEQELTVCAFDIQADDQTTRVIFDKNRFNLVSSIIEGELRKISQDITSLVQSSDMSSTSTLAKDIESFESKRKDISRELDNLIAALKKRDDYVINLGHRYRVERSFICDPAIFSENLLSKFILETKNLNVLLDATINLVRPYHTFKYQDEDHTIFENMVKTKVQQSLNINYETAWTNYAYCYFISSGIKSNYVSLNLASKERVSYSAKMYSKCGVCGKNIYTSQKTYRMEGEEDPFKDYQEELLLPIVGTTLELSNGRILKQGESITLEVLRSSGPYPAPDGYFEARTWDEISSMVSSNDKNVNLEGIKRREAALKTLGAISVDDGRSRYVNATKFRCPYKSERGTTTAAVRDSDCGLYLDLGPIIRGEDVSPQELQPIARTNFDVDSETLFANELQRANIDAAKKQIFLEEFKKRTRGGWKFSNFHFNCPCIIDNLDSNSGDVTKKLSRYSYIASPLSGPVSAANLARFVPDPKVGDLPAYHPPTTPDGGQWFDSGSEDAPIKEGTISYLICGSSTTLSSFSRDSRDAVGSLPALIKKSFEEGTDKGARFIKALIQLGVDVEDIIPFLQNFENPLKALSSIPNNRIQKIAHLLSIASSDINLGKDETFDLLKDLTLVCQNGHKFTIKDSVLFGKTHTGFPINRKQSPFSQDAILRSGILNSVGYENFSNTLRLKNSSNAEYIRPIKLEDRAAFKKQYDEWVSAGLPLSDLYFSIKDEGGNIQTFSYGKVYRDMKNIWGSEFFSGASPLSVMDIETRKQVTQKGSLSYISEEEGDIIGTGEGVGNYSTQDYREEDLKTIPALRTLSKDMLEEDSNGYKIVSLLFSILKKQLNIVRSWLDSSVRLDISDYQALEDIRVLEIEKAKKETPLLSEQEFDSATKELYEGLMILCIEDSGSTDEANQIFAKAKSIMDQKYINTLRRINLNFVQYFGDKAISLLSPEAIGKSLVLYMINGAYQVSPELGSMVREKYDNPSEGVYFSQFNYEDLYDDVKDKVNEFASYVGEKIKFVENAKEVSKILSDPRVKQTSDTDSFTRMMRINGKEYSSRILKGSLAFYMAEYISRIYNMYFVETNSPKFIGYELDLDLSTLDKVVNLTSDQIEQISVDQSFFEDIEEFYLDFYEEVKSCISEFEKMSIFSKTACYSERYTSLALEYMKSRLSNLISSNQLNQEQKDRAQLIIDNVLVLTPFDTIDLNSNGKHKNFFGGKNSVEPLSLVPVFSSPIVEHSSGAYPIFALVGKVKTKDREDVFKLHSFNINVSPPSAGSLKILSNQDLPFSSSEQIRNIEIEETKMVQATYPGWNVREVPLTLNKNSKEYKDGKFYYLDISKLSSNPGLKDGISLYYHPGSQVNFSEDKKSVISISNDEMNFDSSDSIAVGQLSVRTGASRLVPPIPLVEDPVQMSGISNVGVPIPLRYGGEDFISAKEAFPIIDIKIPVAISSSLEIDVSDLLLRYPTSAAFSYLRSINSLYNEMTLKLNQGFDIEDPVVQKYKDQIRATWANYKSLPFFIANKESGSKKEGISIFGKRQEMVKPRRSPYIPFLDWVTANKIINQVFCGPSYGGHSLWGDDFAAEDIAEVKNGIENFLINTNRLDVLATCLEDAVLENEGKKITIDPKDMLDPIENLFNSGKLTEQQFYNYFGYSISEDKDFTSRDNIAWQNMPTDKAERENIQNVAIGKVVKYFSRWLSSSGQFYPIGKYDRTSENGVPYARIVTGNRVFPKTLEQREKIKNAKAKGVQNQILSAEDLYASEYYYGSKAGEEYYPVPQDVESEAYKKYLESLKKVRHIGIKTFAESMANYSQESLLQEIRAFLASEFLKSGGRKTSLLKVAKYLDKR